MALIKIIIQTGFNSSAASFLSSNLANNPASKVPEIECHTHDTTHAITTSGVAAKCAVDKLVASPAF